MKHAAAIAGALLCLAAVGDPADRLANPTQEAHAEALFHETRCLVCQGESIAESDAPLAADMRRVIRRQIAAGETSGQVRAFLRDHYGDFVLFRPPFDWANALLWFGPLAVALAGVGVLVARERARSAAVAQLSPEEEARLAQLTRPDDTPAPKFGARNGAGLTER